MCLPFSDLPPPATMSDMENFHLARNDFDACTRNTFKNLWQDGEVFADVTLACRDKQLKAHKVFESENTLFADVRSSFLFR